MLMVVNLNKVVSIFVTATIIFVGGARFLGPRSTKICGAEVAPLTSRTPLRKQTFQIQSANDIAAQALSG